MGTQFGSREGSQHRTIGPATPFAGFAVCFAVLLARGGSAHAECAPPTPECHLAAGKQLLERDPRRAAEELLASYRLDERTDTLTLYAQALQRSKRYARALDTWQRIILFREGEIETAKELLRKSRGKQRDAARVTVARAQEQIEQAAAQIIELWASVGRVKIERGGDAAVRIWHDGVEIDLAREVLVNAGRDELVVTRKDGGLDKVIETIAIEVAAGQTKTVKLSSAKHAGSGKAARAGTGSGAELTASTRPARQETPRPLPRAEPKAETPSVVTTRALTPVEAATSTRARPTRTLSRVGLGLAAGGLVGAGLAGTLGYLASRDFDRAQTLGCSSDGECPVGPAVELAERSNDRARLAQISAIGGGALLVTGVTLYLVGRGTSKRAESARNVSLRLDTSSTTTSFAIGWSL